MSKTRRPGRNGSGRGYDVGYGRPPKHTRFKPGQSGNPAGRPQGVRNFGTDLKATLNAPVRLMRDGRPRKVSTQEAMLLRLREKALGGEARALDRLLVLAQAYNNENHTVTIGLSTDDAKLLEVFRARVLSGAAGTGEPAEEKTNALDGAPTRKPMNFGSSDETKAKPERVRLKRRTHADHGSQAPATDKDEERHE